MVQTTDDALTGGGGESRSGKHNPLVLGSSPSGPIIYLTAAEFLTGRQSLARPKAVRNAVLLRWLACEFFPLISVTLALRGGLTGHRTPNKARGHFRYPATQPPVKRRRRKAGPR